jgi:hypothetical protein
MDLISINSYYIFTKLIQYDLNHWLRSYDWDQQLRKRIIFKNKFFFGQKRISFWNLDLTLILVRRLFCGKIIITLSVELFEHQNIYIVCDTVCVYLYLSFCTLTTHFKSTQKILDNVFDNKFSMFKHHYLTLFTHTHYNIAWILIIL